MVHRGYRATHLAHDLFSLYKIKATSERIQLCYDEHATFLETPTPSQQKINERNWTEFLGKDKYRQDYRDFFDAEIASIGFIPALYKYLPTLIPTLMSAAFHPFIHLGFAVEFSQPFILSEALGYWCADSVNTTKLDEYDSRKATKGLFDIVGVALKDTELLNRAKEHEMFAIRARNAQRNGGGEIINSYIEQWKISNEDDIIDNKAINDRVKDLRNATLHAFISGGGRHGNPPAKLDFFLCHGVTSCHALHCIVKYLQEHPHSDSLRMQIDLLRYYLQGILITCFAQGGVEVNPDIVEKSKIGGNVDEEWKMAFDLAIRTIDHHVPKAVCAFKQNEIDYGFNNGLYLKAAKRTVEMVKDSYQWEFSGAGFKNGLASASL